MTPQLAQLTIHAPDDGEAVYDQGGSLVGFPAARLVDGDERTLPSLLRRESLYRRLLSATDVLGATLALAVVLNLLSDDRPAVAVLVTMPLIALLFKIAGLYDLDQLRIVHSTLDEAPILLQLTGLYALGVTIMQPIFVDGHLGGDQIAALWVLTFVVILGGRALARWVAGRLWPRERCLVIGDPGQADRVREKLVSSRAPASVIATLPLDTDDIHDLTAPENIRHLALELGIDRIIIAPGEADASGVAELIRVAKAAGVRVNVLPRLFEVVGSAVELEDVDGMTMLGVRPFGLPRSSHALKRALDIIGASLGLVVVAPAIAAIAIVIKRDSHGPIFFRQVRVGRDGRHFHIYKFRSMVVDAERQKDGLRTLNEVGDGMFKITSDPRVTRVGGFLRRTSLDELPQIFNVLRGEMSLVGPRPLVVDEDAQVLGLDRSRLHLTPGMTGPWQVLGARVPMQEMVGIDYLYVTNWSLWLDVRILLRTIHHVLRRRNI